MMTPDEAFGLFQHFLSQPAPEDEERQSGVAKSQVVSFAQAIERAERASCANEIHTGHQEYCSGRNCDCQQLHRLIRNRTGGKKFRADVIAQAKPEMFEDLRKDAVTTAVMNERTRLLACIDAAKNKLDLKQQRSKAVKDLLAAMNDFITKAPVE